jgi:anti-sigma B factor antagonist
VRPLARVVEGHDGETPTAAIEGEIDASNTDDIAARLRSLVTNHSKSLVVGLVATTYIDSAGINLLFELDAELSQRQQQLHLVVAESSPIARMIAITGLDGAVPVHATLEAAARAASA